LELSTNELARITAPTINVGDASSGTINITSAINHATADINLTSGASINFTAGSITTNGGNLVLAPGGTGSVGVSNINTDVTVGAGTLSIAGNGNLAIPINGTSQGQPGGFDQLRVSGNVNLTGANLVLSGGFTPAAGNTFTVVNNFVAAN